MFQHGFSKDVAIAINFAGKGAGFPAIAIFQAERTRGGWRAQAMTRDRPILAPRRPGPRVRR